MIRRREVVDLDHHLLAARQEIVLGEGVAMGNLIELVAAGDVLHPIIRPSDRPIRVHDSLVAQSREIARNLLLD
jgi:hypothetical protein